MYPSRGVFDHPLLLTSHWLELDRLEPLKLKCFNDISLHKQYVEKSQVFSLLARLNGDSNPSEHRFFTPNHCIHVYGIYYVTER